MGEELVELPHDHLASWSNPMTTVTSFTNPSITEKSAARKNHHSAKTKLATSGSLQMPRPSQPPFRPALALQETSEHFYLQFALPGLECHNIDIHLERDRGIIRGNGPKIWGIPSGRILQSELNHGTFERQFELPAPVKYDQAIAEYSHGILTLIMSKV